MLIEFRVENHRSLRDEQVLTMEAGRVGDESDPRPRKVTGYPVKLLPVAGLYGANASGKSNVLMALDFMLRAILASHRVWLPDEGIPRDPFAWEGKKEKPSLYEVTFITDGVRYQYGLSASDDCFLEEWLYAWPKGKKQIWFERDNNKYKYGEHFKGDNKLIENVVRPNALFLSTAVQHNHPQLQVVSSWFKSIKPLNVSHGRFFLRPKSAAANDLSIARMYSLVRMADAYEAVQPTFSADEDSLAPFTEQIGDLLKNADMGIVDMQVNYEKDKDSHHDIQFVKLKHNSQSDTAWLPLDEESNGVRILFRISLPILQALQKGGLLLVDELERSLHPYLARQIINQFNDPKTNPNNAQLIFTTHDTNLLGTMLGEPALRRDQVWLTEKNQEGATELYPLTNYKPRKDENIERGYLQGRYGAIPFVENFSVTGE